MGEEDICFRILTRYYRIGRPVFDNILDIKNKSKISDVLDKISISDPGHRDSEDYLKKRIEFEEYVYEEVIRKGLSPALKHPIYMFLGRKKYYGSTERPWTRTGWVSIDISHFSNKDISFTYVDPLQVDRKPKIYLLNELDEMFEKHQKEVKRFLPEVHVWNSEPLLNYLNKNQLDKYGGATRCNMKSIA
ncbi:hypothetical protein PV797_14550 [Clostridiaceae bacterium M8S5]|nr:hypothetical protein PV797_14550 [Clostridiaceae bacterium M8S5]